MDDGLNQILERLKRQPPSPFGATLGADEQRRERIQARAMEAGVPLAYVRALRVPQVRPAMRAVTEWDAGPKQALLLAGANQAGKSCAAAHWLTNLERGTWLDTWQLGQAVQPPANTDLLRGLRRCAALVIDNVGERCGPAGYEEMESILMHMIAQGRRLIVTTDRGPDHFFGLFGDQTHNRIWSRWRLFGAVVEVPSWP